MEANIGILSLRPATSKYATDILHRFSCKYSNKDASNTVTAAKMWTGTI